MHDRTLILLSLCVSALGIIALLLALALMSPEQAQDISALADGEPVLVRGSVVSSRDAGEHHLLTLDTRAQADVMLFDGKGTEIEEGSCVEVSGKKGSYKGRPQVVASRIERCADGENARDDE